MKKEIECMCEHKFEIELPDSIDLKADPHYLNEINNGTFQTHTCPECGNNLKPEFPLLVKHTPGNHNIFMVPEPYRLTFLRGKYDTKQADRVVIGYPELVEKLQIFSDNLKDDTIEIIKYHLFKKAEESQGDETLDTDENTDNSFKNLGNSGISIYFHGYKDDNLTFHVHGLRKNEIGVTSISSSLYRDINDNMEIRYSDEMFVRMLKPPYVSINSLLLEE